MKLIILDRDGVINEDSDEYIKSPEEWIPISGSLDAMARLTHAGYRSSTAASAEDALALIKRHPPDLILLDVGLPGMDGLEALRHFHQDMDVPVIFVTARRRELDTILGLELGADGYITKPFRIKALLEDLAQCIHDFQQSRKEQLDT